MFSPVGSKLPAQDAQTKRPSVAELSGLTITTVDDLQSSVAASVEVGDGFMAKVTISCQVDYLTPVPDLTAKVDKDFDLQVQRALALFFSFLFRLHFCLGALRIGSKLFGAYCDLRCRKNRKDRG